MDFKSDIRFRGIEPFDSKVWLSSPTMHGDEMEYVTKAYETNWMSTTILEHSTAVVNAILKLGEIPITAILEYGEILKTTMLGAL